MQEPLAGIEPEFKVTVDVPPNGGGAIGNQSAFGAAAIVTPLGNVSMRGAVRVATAGSGLLKVMVSVDVPSAGMLAGLKSFASAGGM